MPEASARYTLKSVARFRRVGDEAVVIRQSVARAIVLNQMGARVLDLIAERLSWIQLIDRLGGRFRVDRDTLERDVERFLVELREGGLVEDPLVKDGDLCSERC